MTNKPKKLKYCAGGQWLESKTEKYMDCYNPSTGEIIARAPQCTDEEVEAVIMAAQEAFVGWSEMPVNNRVQVLFRMKALVEKHLDDLTYFTETKCVTSTRFSEEAQEGKAVDTWDGTMAALSD